MSEQYEVLAVRYGTRQASAAEVFLKLPRLPQAGPAHW